jgi:hypothetical protein
MKFRLMLATGIAIVAIVLPFSVRASLGGDMSSVQDDQAKLQGTLRATGNETYNVQEIQTPNGIVVREFVSLSGNVFGIAWQGRTHPDLRQVLGAYYDPYMKAVQAQRAQRHGHGPLLIEQPGLFVQIIGHMGALTGRAYLPQNLPPGIRPEVIR